MTLPNEIVNHIFSYCQGRTNKIMKDHFVSIENVYYNEYIVSSRLKYILQIMELYGHKHFNKERFYSRYYSCVNCRRIGISQPYIEFGEKFCSSYCADMFDY